MKKYILFCLLLMAGQLFADDCIFDPTSANDSFLSKNPNIDHYKWNDKDKEATGVLKDGSLLYVKKWACQHVGMDARLIEFYGNTTKELNEIQIKRIIWFGSQILDKADFEKLKNSILKKTYKREERSDGYILIIPHDTYSEFYVEITSLNYMQVIAIAYYFS